MYLIDHIPCEDKEPLLLEWRRDWIRDGCPWHSKSRNPPENWNLREQLESLKKG